MITLGGNIQLEGFDELEYGEVLIAKKLVGNYIRIIAENCENCELALIHLEKKEEQFCISVQVKIEDKEVHSSVEEDNLFFSIDKGLKEVISKLNIKL